MGNIEQKLNDYIWDNLKEFKSIFSEKFYTVLLKERYDYDDEERFQDILNIAIDTNPEILKEVKKRYDNIDKMTIFEIIEKLESFYFYSFLNKEKYIKRAIECLRTYSDKDDYLISLANLLAEYFISINDYNKAKVFLELSLKVSIELEYERDIISSYRELINFYIILKNNKKVDSLLSESLAFYKKNNFDLSSWDYHNFAKFYQKISNNIETKKFYKKALEKLKIEYKKHKRDNTYEYNYQQISHDFENFKQLTNENEETKFVFLNRPNIEINKLKIKNFKQYQNFSMDFSKQINIIIGQNATGKTTLLQAITLGLLKEDSLDAKKLEYDDYISKGQEKSELVIYHTDNEEKKVTILKEKREIDKNYFIPFVLTYGSNFFTSKTNEVKEVAQSIIKKSIHRDFTTSIFMDYTNGFVNPIRLLEFLDLEKDERVPDIQQTFISVINGFLENFKLIATEDKNYYFQKIGTKIKLSLEELSEGYRGNVLLITDMVIKILGVGRTPKTIEGIVLIDEFDKHLHPKWQSKLVNQLTETFPKIQFIMTTHNPMSILGRKAEEITMIKEVDGEIIAQKGEGTESMDVSNVLLQYFDVDSVVGKSMQDKIRRFNELRVNDDTNNEEYKRLNQEILNSEFGVLTLDSDYLEYLKSKKRNNPPQNRNFDNIGDFL